MEENLNKRVDVELDNQNDRRNLVLLKFIKDRSDKENDRYCELMQIYLDNDYFERQLVDELIEVGLMEKNITKNRKRTESGFAEPGEFTPVTTSCGRLALSNRFPSEYEDRKRTLRQYRINKGGFFIAVVGGILGLISFISSFLT